MKAIIDEIIQEKSQANPKTDYIQYLQQLLDLKRIECSDYIKTGRRMSKHDFLSKYPLEELEENCTDVILFMLGLVVQVINGGDVTMYYAQTKFDGVNVHMESENLNSVVQFLFNIRVDDTVNIWKKDL
jgi:hypothetical protein